MDGRPLQEKRALTAASLLTSSLRATHARVDPPLHRLPSTAARLFSPLSFSLACLQDHCIATPCPIFPSHVQFSLLMPLVRSRVAGARCDNFGLLTTPQLHYVVRYVQNTCSTHVLETPILSSRRLPHVAAAPMTQALERRPSPDTTPSMRQPSTPCSSSPHTTCT